MNQFYGKKYALISEEEIQTEKKKIEKKKKSNVVTNDLTYSEAHTALCTFFKSFQSLLFMTEILF